MAPRGCSSAAEYTQEEETGELPEKCLLQLVLSLSIPYLCAWCPQELKHKHTLSPYAGNAPESSYRCCEEDSSVLMNVQSDFKQCVSSVWKENRQDSFSQQLLNFCGHSPPVRKRCRDFFFHFGFIFIFIFVFSFFLILHC